MKIGDDVDLRRIAEDTELFTGAELEGLCREAGIVALRENISATMVEKHHFQTVKESLKPALTREEIESYSSFMKDQALMSPAGQQQGMRHKSSSLGVAFPIKVGVLSVILLAAGKYIFMQTGQTPHELVVT